MADKNKPTAAPATPEAPAGGEHRNYNERRWMKPSKRAEGYAKDRRAKVHSVYPRRCHAYRHYSRLVREERSTKR